MAQNPNYENYEQEICNSDTPADGYSQGYTDNERYDEAPDGEDVKTGEADLSEITVQAPVFAPADPFPFPLTSVIPEGLPQFAENADIDPTPYVKRKPVKKNMAEDKMPRYIAWADAWKWTKSHYPAACYEYLTSAGGAKKYRESDYGVVVGIYLSLDGEKFFRCVELPVLDSHNMSRKPYPYMGTNTYGDKFSVAPPDESDINKAQKRCLTKAIAEVTGFGIRLWGKDDAPNNIRKASVAPEMIADLREKLPLCNLKEQTVVAMVNNQNFGNIQTLDELTPNAYVAIMGMLTRKLMQNGQTGNSAMKPSPAVKPEPAQAASPTPQAAPVQEAAPAPAEKPANEQPKQPRTRTAKPAQKPTAKPAPAEKPAPTVQPTQPAPDQPAMVEPQAPNKPVAAPVEKPAPAPVQNAAPTPAPVQKPVAQAAPVQKPAPQAAPIEKPAPAKEAVPAQAENTDPFDNPFAGFDDFNPDEFGFDI